MGSKQNKLKWQSSTADEYSNQARETRGSLEPDVEPNKSQRGFLDRRVEQGDFYDYRPLRIHEIPRIELCRVAQGDAPGVAPAIANAVRMATGKRPRK